MNFFNILVEGQAIKSMMDNLFNVIEFHEKNMIKLSQVNKYNFIRYMKKYLLICDRDKIDEYTRRIVGYKKISRLFDKNKMITLLILTIKEKFYIDMVLGLACKVNDINLVNFAINKGADWFNIGLTEACRMGYKELVYLMISPPSITPGVGAKDWHSGLSAACEGGKREIVDIIISLTEPSFIKDDNIYWDSGLAGACKGGHRDLVELMISPPSVSVSGIGAKNFNCGLYEACHGGHMDIVEFLISLGASYWN